MTKLIVRYRNTGDRTANPGSNSDDISRDRGIVGSGEVLVQRIDHDGKDEGGRENRPFDDTAQPGAIRGFSGRVSLAALNP